jgi:selenide,water dikinase
MQAHPIAKELVLIGGGHSHVIVLRMLGMNPIPGLQVTLISPSVKTPYSGMLPGVVAGHYEEDDIHIDLVPLCRFAGVRFLQDKVSGMDLANNLIHCESRPDVRFDVVSIDIGITPDVKSVPGAYENVIPVKPIDEFLNRWRMFETNLSSEGQTNIGFVGAGAGGVELCLAVHHRLQQTGQQQNVKFHLFHDGDEILKEYSQGVQSRFHKVLSQRNIRVWSNFRVEKIEDRTIISVSGEKVVLNEIFWVTSAAPQSWLSHTGLELDEAGFISVDETLQSTSHENVFAVGDIANVVKHPRPKAGVYAVRQGPPLFENLCRIILGQATKPFTPQSEFLSLISTGDKSAVAHRNGRSIGGGWVWRWKNWIDQRFMKRFAGYPQMTVEKKIGLLANFDDQMHCGGCGSKVSAELLNEVLDELGIAESSSEHRDDAALYRVPENKVMLHSVDSFRNFIDDPFVFAQIAVSHALSDIYAMGGKPVTALAIITVPFAKPAVTKALLTQLMAGAQKQLNFDDVQLVGGHTSEGAELSVGFSVNGIIDEARILKKSGMQAGDALILTKPLGTGAIFAADMQHKAKGQWVENALRVMQQSNGAGMSVLLENQASSCTDVTGFGLAGHLKEMMLASGNGVRLDLDKIPTLEGALQSMDAGITSTLHEGNRSALPTQMNLDAQAEILFDPQTSGGLLASVPEQYAQPCIDALIEAGYAESAVIGRVTEAIEFDINLD